MSDKKIVEEGLSRNVKQYIKASTEIHRQRMQRIEQTNKIIQKQYKHHDGELKSLDQKKKEFNKELDGIINMLNGVDKMETMIQQTQQNVKQIFFFLSKIQKKVKEKQKQKGKK